MYENEDQDNHCRAFCSSAPAYCGAVDGIFGSGTRTGVEDYQRARGLSVDGQAGYNTKTTLWYEIGQYR